MDQHRKVDTAAMYPVALVLDQISTNAHHVVVLLHSVLLTTAVTPV